MAVPKRTELETESTAYVTCQALGLDTSEYSFGYVANWAGGGDEAIAAIRTSGERIQKTAARILRLAGLARPCGWIGPCHLVGLSLRR